MAFLVWCNQPLGCSQSLIWHWDQLERYGGLGTVGVRRVLSSSSCPVPVAAQSTRAISSECGVQGRLVHELCMGFLNISNFSIFEDYGGGDAQPTSPALCQWVRLSEVAGRKDRVGQDNQASRAEQKEY